MDIDTYKEKFLNHLHQSHLADEPDNLYHPINYIMNLGGKRMRPILVQMSCDLFDGNIEDAKDAALCVEMFHNFTLIHDDIMDGAELRRSQPTVHSRWDVNTGILSGDALMILAYRRLESYSGDVFKSLMHIFNKTALEVCEGQQLDMDFESMDEVSLPLYMKMIAFKTAVLVACSLQMGAIIAQANTTDQDQVYQFGMNLGLAFQLQDDFLDSFGTAAFGKKIGGDILENKKTFLYIKTLQSCNETDKKRLLEMYKTEMDQVEKINGVKELFKKYKADELILNEIKEFTNRAYQNIESLSVDDDKKRILRSFAEDLMNRKT